MVEEISLPDGFRLLPLQVCESTNTEARRLAREGAPDSVVVWARQQTGGRGRWGRDWYSPRGNLYCSLLLRPEGKIAEALALGFAAGLAVADAVAELTGVGGAVQIKWPNDVLAGGRKIAGILLESEADGDGLAWLVVGIGLNVAKAPDKPRWPATTLRQCGARVPVEVALETVVRWFDFWRRRLDDDGFEALREAWEARAYGLGQEITVGQGENSVTGRLIGLTGTGGLRMETAAGEAVLSYGDIFPPAEG